MDRRKFLVKGGITAAALVTGTSVLAEIGSSFSTKKVINIGIIGTGARGTGLIPFLNIIEGLNVYACCDVLPFRLEKAIERTNGKAKSYTNYKDLLNDKSIDAVLIASTFSTHAQIALDAIDANKHIYCEKTMAKGYDGIRNILSKMKTSKIVFQTGHQYHSSRLYTHVVKLLQDGKVGKISGFESQWNINRDWRRPVPDESLERAVNWRMYREYSGGLLAELCSHQIDFVNSVLGENPLQVMGTGGVDYWKDGRETFDNIHLTYNYPKGVKAKFTCITSNKKDGYRIKVLGDKGTLVITTTSAKFYPENNKKKRPQVPKDVDGVSGATWQADDIDYYETIDFSHKNPSKQALIDFRDSILENKKPESNVVSGAKAAICVQMGLDAMHNNDIVFWDSKFEI